MKNVAIGDRCFYDSFGGTIRARFAGFKPSPVSGKEDAVVVILESRAGYSKGETVRTASYSHIVHSRSLVKRGHEIKIRCDYTLDGRQIFA